LSARLNKLCRWHRRVHRPPDLAFQCCSNAGGVGSRRVRVNLQRLLDQSNGWFWIVVFKVGANSIENMRSFRAADMETAIGKRTVIAWRNEKIIAPFPRAGARDADVDDPAEPQI